MTRIPRRTAKELSEAEAELFEKVWYNRHMIRHEKENQPHHDLSFIGCDKALEIERKYGPENLEWDDFEWGMLNGKFSAVRWAMGDEWDFLDT